MNNLNGPTLHSMRRCNQRFQVLMTKCLDTLIAPSVGRTAVTSTAPSHYPPERQDLYGFAVSDFLASRSGTE